MFKACIQALTAHLISSEFILESTPFKNGTRQGCPLSPLLFNLAKEPLSHLLNTHLQITIGNKMLHAALFMYDILVFSLYVPLYLAIIQSLFSDLHLCSSLCKNIFNSEILQLNPSCAVTWSASSPLWIAHSYITYMGICIVWEPSSLHHLNYPLLY